jgi:hypothetical protein
MDWRGSENFANLPPIVNAKQALGIGIFGFSTPDNRGQPVN